MVKMEQDDLGDVAMELTPPKRSLEEINNESADSNRPSKRARKQSACQRCRSRKQGCDSIFPACKNCQKAKTECIRPPESLNNSNGSNETLRERIAELENRLAMYETTSTQTRKNSQAGLGVESRPFSPPESSHESMAGSVAPTTHTTPTPSRQKDIADVVGFLSLGAEPTYVGPSSGFSMAANLSEMVQATVWNKILASAATAEKPGAPMSFAEMRLNSAGPPDDEDGIRILEAYWSRVHPRYPFLHRKDVYQSHKNRFQTPTTVQQQFDTFKLYMIYAIGSTMLKLTEPYESTPPEKFFMTALQYISAARESNSVNNVIAMTMMVIYHLRSPSHTGIWYMIGLAMRTCLDLGLHREAHYTRLDPSFAEVKRRLFWSVYTLERVIAVSLGRPLSVQDRDIDVHLPLDVDDTITDAVKLRHAASVQRPNPQNQATSHPSLKPRPLPTPPPSALSISIHIARLKQHESRILSNIYRVDVMPRTLIPEIPALLSGLDNWKARIPSPIPSSDTIYLLLQYHKAVRLLLQPFLSLLPISSPYHTLCLNSSGQICQIFKRMHSVEAYGHSFVAVHSVFVAGVTICYCLWLSPHLWSFATSNSLRACSSVLHVIAERSNAVKKYRDVFEELIDATMECMERKREDVKRMKMPMGLGGDGTLGGKTNWLWRDDDVDDSNFGLAGMGLGVDDGFGGSTGFDASTSTGNLNGGMAFDSPFEKFRRTTAWETFAQGLGVGNGNGDLDTDSSTAAAMSGTGNGHQQQQNNNNLDLDTDPVTAGGFSLDTPTADDSQAGVTGQKNGGQMTSSNAMDDTTLLQGEDAEVGRMLMGMMNGTTHAEFGIGPMADGGDMFSYD